MARPIEPTPPISGKDAEDLLVSLEDVATPEEIAKRLELAKQHLAELTRPKGYPLRSPRKKPPER